MPQDGTGAGGTRRMLMSAAIAGLLLFAGAAIWILGPWQKLPTPEGGAPPQSAPDLTEGRGAPAQRAAESLAGKRDPAQLPDGSGGRARELKETSQPLSLTGEQQTELAGIIRNDNPQRQEKVPFELMIGAAVPQQVDLRVLPAEAAQVMNGYWGNQYTVVGDTLVIVDLHSRRVVAIVPNV